MMLSVITVIQASQNEVSFAMAWRGGASAHGGGRYELRMFRMKGCEFSARVPLVTP
jgi:hypothetical protein